MEWKHEFSVHVPAIDEDHRILVECVTEIEQAVAVGEKSAVIISAIGEFIHLARTHFNHEVALMRFHDYPDIDAHIKAHKTFLAELARLEKKSLAESLSNEAVEFLHTWLEEHVASYDKHYASYFSLMDNADK